MNKHTPAPWHVANGVQIRSERDQIAKVWMMRHGEGKANAHLIAAAPELLEALAQFVAWVDAPCESAFSDSQLEKARAAIAKARGES